MDANAVNKIYKENLAKHESVDDALAISYKEIGENVFAETVRDQYLNVEDREMVLKTIDAQSHLCYFWRMGSGRLSITHAQLYAHLGFLFSVWEQGLRHIYDRYEIQSEKFRSEYTREHLKEIADSVAAETQKESLEAATTGYVTVTKDRFDSMYGAFCRTLRNILGDEIFEKFREDFNTNLTILQMLHLEATTIKTKYVM